VVKLWHSPARSLTSGPFHGHMRLGYRLAMLISTPCWAGLSDLASLLQVSWKPLLKRSRFVAANVSFWGSRLRGPTVGAGSASETAVLSCQAALQSGLSGQVGEGRL